MGENARDFHQTTTNNSHRNNCELDQIVDLIYICTIVFGKVEINGIGIKGNMGSVR